MSSTRHHGRYNRALFCWALIFIKYSFFLRLCISTLGVRGEDLFTAYFVRPCPHTNIVVVQWSRTGARWPLFFVCPEASFAVDSRVSVRGGNRAARISLNELVCF